MVATKRCAVSESKFLKINEMKFGRRIRTATKILISRDLNKPRLMQRQKTNIADKTPVCTVAYVSKQAVSRFCVICAYSICFSQVLGTCCGFK